VPDAALVDFTTPEGLAKVFRTALCFWQDDGPRGSLAHAAGPWAIAEFLDFPQGSRFLQSFKSVAASPTFEHANLFEKRLRFEELGEIFLRHLVRCGGQALASLPARVVVGRPVRFVGARPDEALRAGAMTRCSPASGARCTMSTNRWGQRSALPGACRARPRCWWPTSAAVRATSRSCGWRRRARRALPAAWLGGDRLAGDRFDYRIMDKLVLPILGKGGTYRSFDKVLDIPDGHFTDFGDWSRLALMRNRRTLEELARLRRAATDPAAIDRMIAVVDKELGYPLYEAVGRLKRALSGEEGDARFENENLTLQAPVTRAEFAAGSPLIWSGSPRRSMSRWNAPVSPRTRSTMSS
jgi:hypothetical chaperone protein